jgi:hypothetical protein
MATFQYYIFVVRINAFKELLASYFGKMVVSTTDCFAKICGM